jgi:hypothetical protein
MQGRPVGLKYNGSDFKSVLLSFPLYYIDTIEARNFLRHVLMQIFVTPSDIGVKGQMSETISLRIHPNPLSIQTSFRIHLGNSSSIKLSIFNMEGKRFFERVERQMPAGDNIIHFNASQLPSGVYTVLLNADRNVILKKMIVIN